MGKFSISVNVAKNRMYNQMEGFFTDDEIHKYVECSQAETKKLKPGYVAINIISDFKPASAQGYELLKKATEECVVKYHPRIIRVEAKNQLANLQYNRLGKEAKAGETLVVYSLDVAEKLADTLG